MKKETRQLLDIIIDKMNLERSTGMCREEIRKNIDKAATLLDLSVCLADVVDSMMMDVADIAAKVKIPMMDDRERSYFKELKKLVNAVFRKEAKKRIPDRAKSVLLSRTAEKRKSPRKRKSMSASVSGALLRKNRFLFRSLRKKYRKRFMKNRKS